MRRIVLLGWWCWPFLTAARSCRRQNIQVFLLEIGPPPCRWRHYSSCLAGGARLPAGYIHTAKGLELIRRFTTGVRADALAALNNNLMLWLAQNRSLFEPECKLLMPPVEVLAWENSKCRQIELAKAVGLEVLPTHYLAKTADCLSVPGKHYPLLLRPNRKQRNIIPFKVKTVYSPGELRAMLDAFDPDFAPAIAQPMVSLPNLVVHGARSETGAILAMEAFLVPRKFEAVTLTIRPCEFPPGVEQGCRDFVQQVGGSRVAFTLSFLILQHRKRPGFSISICGSAAPRTK